MTTTAQFVFITIPLVIVAGGIGYTAGTYPQLFKETLSVQNLTRMLKRAAGKDTE